MSFTLAITSCGRHDLLERTIRSFVECTSVNPIATVIVEDGPTPKPAWLDSFHPRLGKVKWINNVERMGQAYTIDRLYSEISTEYIFWCEDDWEFHEQNFLSRSFQILRDFPAVSMVGLRSDWNHPLVPASSGGLTGGSSECVFQLAEPYWGGVWGGTCWNPGLRRLSDFKRFGSYGRVVGYGTNGLGHEKVWSKLHLDSGYRIAVLPSHCRHIGGERSRAIEQLEHKLPRILIAVPACRSFDYGRWESGQSPHYNPKNEPYGSDIHISGENPRIQAVRETWWKDLAPFAPNVEGRFFYGTEGAQLPDEVNIPVGDTYADLPAKTREICRWALDNGFDYLFKCDDDTAVYVDRIVTEVLQNRFDYAGHEHCGVCTGGPGYFLSKRAMRAVVAAGTADHWAEDCWVAKVMGQQNIHPVHLNEHIPGYSAHWVWPTVFDPAKLYPNPATLHAVQPEMMRAWYKHINSGQ